MFSMGDEGNKIEVENKDESVEMTIRGERKGKCVTVTMPPEQAKRLAAEILFASYYAE